MISNQYAPSAPNMPQNAYPPAYTPLQVMPGQQVPIQPSPLNALSWGKVSQNASCPFCRTTAPTRVQYERGVLTWASCAAISLLGGNCGCCLIPFFVDEFKDSYHYCQVCNSLLGTFLRPPREFSGKDP